MGNAGRSLMSREDHKRRLIAFLETIRRADVSLDTFDERDGLVSSGLIDSLALLEIITFLEVEFGVDFSERGVDPDELGSIAEILDLIEQRGA
jgi:acyl carrier protein